MDNNKKKLNLVLDLDQTLIHTDITPMRMMKNNIDYSHLLVQFQDGAQVYTVYFRPYVFEFIKNMSEHYNLYVYTNGTKQYCSIVVNMLVTLLNFNPFVKIQHRETESTIKYLTKLDIQMHNTIIIDDLPTIWDHGVQNIFAIKRFFGKIEEPENELNILEKKLINIIKAHEQNEHIDIPKLVQQKNENYIFSIITPPSSPHKQNNQNKEDTTIMPTITSSDFWTFMHSGDVMEKLNKLDTLEDFDNMNTIGET